MLEERSCTLVMGAENHDHRKTKDRIEGETEEPHNVKVLQAKSVIPFLFSRRFVGDDVCDGDRYDRQEDGYGSKCPDDPGGPSLHEVERLGAM